MRVRSYRCPECGQKTGVDIIYGLPTEDDHAAADRREIALGGCIIEEGAPERYCTACGHEWMIQRRKTSHDD
jgi:predicted RNA-binding Zn-ribbon protein involved in translation (DUF1610 family)